MKRALIALLIIALLLPGASIAAGTTVKPLVTAPVAGEKEAAGAPAATVKPLVTVPGTDEKTKNGDPKAPEQEAWLLIEEAADAYDEGAYGDCIELARKAAALTPDNADILTSAAMLIYDADTEMLHDEEIMQLLRTALRTAGGQTRTAAVKLLSGILSTYDRYDEAIALVQDELDRAADFEQLRYQKAELLYYAERYDEALATLDELLEDSPQNFDAMYLRGMLMLDTYRFDEALKTYTQIDKGWPETMDGLYGMYYTYKASGDFNRASRLIDTMLQSGGSDTLWYDRAALALWNMFDPKRAVEEAKSLIRRDPESVDYLGLMAGALMMLERYDEAMDVIAKIAPLDETYADMLHGLILMDKAEWQDAGNTFSALAEEAPDYAYAYVQAADVRLDGFGDVKGAKAWLAKAFALSGEYTMADQYISLGRAYSREGNLLEAARAFTKGDEMTYDDPRALHYVALVYADAGRLDGLAETVGTMERKYPGWYDTMAARVLLEDMSGRYAEAVAAFDALKAKYGFMAGNLAFWEGGLRAQAGLEGGSAMILKWIESNVKNATGDDWASYAYALIFEGDLAAAEEAIGKADAYIAAHDGDPSADLIQDRISTESTRAFLKMKQGDDTGCIEALKAAIDAGMPASALMLHAQFQPIAGTPEFIALFGDYETLKDWDLSVGPVIPE